MTRTDPQILAEHQARERNALFGKPASEIGRLARRQINLVSRIGIHGDKEDDKIRRELAEIGRRLEEIANPSQIAAE